MTMDTVVNHWMEPATLNKKNIINGEKKSFEHNGMVRIPLGEKGIGRFGAHKLGNYIKLVSRAENDGEKEVCFEINWGDFDNDKYLSDVGVEVYERKPEIFLGNKSGTRIEIRGLRHVWTAKEYRNVYRNILALNSPFKAADSFSVNIFSNHQQWEKDLISFEELKDKALYKAKIVLEDCMIKEYTYEFEPWEILNKVKYRKSKEYQNTYIYDLEDKKNKTIINLKPFEIGTVVIELRIFDLDSYILNLGFPNDKNTIKKYLKQNGGVSIYRDNMRLYEYGEESNDWLGLESRRINNPSKALSGHLVVGAVYLDRLDSTDLIEKTSREGFIENSAYDCFVKAVLYAISCVENDRMIDKADLRMFYSGTFKTPVEDGIQGAKNIASVLVSVLENIVQEKNGPYIIVLWTNEIALKDEVEEYMMSYLKTIKETTLPTYICAFDKKEFVSKPQELLNNLSVKLVEQNMINFLIEWENESISVASNMVRLLLYGLRIEMTNSALQDIFIKMAQLEDSYVNDKKEATRNILQILVEFLRDRYLEIISNEQLINRLAENWGSDFEEKKKESKEISIEQKGCINSLFNINLYDDVDRKLPGKVYVRNNSSINFNETDFMCSTLSNKWYKDDEIGICGQKVKLNRKIIEVDITPNCDYAQNKNHMLRNI